LNEDLQKRISAASGYFNGKIAELIIYINQSSAETDSRIKAQSFNDAMNDLFIGLALKQHIIAGIQASFTVEEYYKARRSFIVPGFKVDAYAGGRTSSSNTTESTHPALLQQLRTLRAEICQVKDMPVYIVAGNTTLLELSNYLPLNPLDLEKITGFGPAKIKNYGKQFLDVINAYCIENGLSTLIDQKKGSKARKDRELKIPKIDTKLTSFQYYQSGRTPQEIAELRGFTIGTIHGHLAHYVITGDIQLSELIDADRIKLIETAIYSSPEDDLNALKLRLGDEISYGEIRLVSKLCNDRENVDKDIAD
jgi:Helix-turn-helix domain/HRDC domain